LQQIKDSRESTSSCTGLGAKLDAGQLLVGSLLGHNKEHMSLRKCFGGYYRLIRAYPTNQVHSLEFPRRTRWRYKPRRRICTVHHWR